MVVRSIIRVAFCPCAMRSPMRTAGPLGARAQRTDQQRTTLRYVKAWSGEPEMGWPASASNENTARFPVPQAARMPAYNASVTWRSMLRSRIPAASAASSRCRQTQRLAESRGETWERAIYAVAIRVGAWLFMIPGNSS